MSWKQQKLEETEKELTEGPTLLRQKITEANLELPRYDDAFLLRFLRAGGFILISNFEKSITTKQKHLRKSPHSANSGQRVL